MALIRFLLLISMTFSPFALAIPLGPTTNVSVGTQAGLVHKIALLGKDGRELVSEYQDRKNKGRPSRDQIDYRKKFEATGILNCGGSIGSAQLSGAADVITTASHAFWGKNCEPWLSEGLCFFETAGQKVMVDMTSVRGSCPYPDMRKDWAVVKLKKAIKDVQPYAIPDQDWYLDEGRNITQVSAANKSNFKNRSQEKTVQDCRVRNVFKKGVVAATHDCDTDKYTSGASQLDAETYMLVGIHVGGQNLKNGDYQLPHNYNALVPLNGEFLSELRRAVDSSTATKARRNVKTESYDRQ